MKILFLCERKETIYLYKKIKSRVSYFNIDYEKISDSQNINFLNYKLIIIDLVSKKYLEKLKNIITDKVKIIVVSSFTFDYSYINSSIDQILIKPIDLKDLLNLIFNYNHLIQRSFNINDVLLKDLINKSPISFALYDRKGNLIYHNDKYLNMNKDYKVDNFTFDTLKIHQQSFNQILEQVKLKKIYYKLSSNDNIWYKNYYYEIKDTSYIVHSYENITDEILNVNKLKMASVFFEESNEGMYITNKNGIILETNNAFLETTGYKKEELIGKKLNILNSGIQDSNFYKDLWSNIIYKGKWQGEIWNKRKNGEIYPEWLSINKISNNEPEKESFIAISNDVTIIKNNDKKLQFYANYDPLTKLLNRMQFDNLLSQVINTSSRKKTEFALLFIDIDNFKEVNDTYGHLVGDKLLRIVANRLRETLRKEDLIARVGGDEFNIILENIYNKENALLIAEKLNDEIKKNILIENKDFSVSLSIGIAMFPNHGLSIDTLTKHADIAMYEVKNAGKNGIKLYDSKYTDNLLKKVTIQNELKEDIINNNLKMYYQPIFNAKTKLLEGAEALVRWEHKEKGFIPPDEFIFVAEKSDLIITLGKYIVEKVFEDILIINSNINKNKMIFGINISSKQFFEEFFVENFLEKLKDFGIDAKQIEIEITETHIMKNHHIAIDIFNKLKKHGIKLAIDDFGTGYSSLSYLKDFPVDKLKIDKSFVSDILINNDDLAIVKTIITMAKIFNLEVQAEGVESKEQLNQLENLDCKFIQGYYYAKPMPVNNFIEFVNMQ